MRTVEGALIHRSGHRRLRVRQRIVELGCGFQHFIRPKE